MAMNLIPLLIAQAEAVAAPVSNGLLDRIDDDQLFVVLLVAIGCGTGGIIALVGIAAGVWSSVRQRQIESEMKQDMLDRGHVGRGDRESRQGATQGGPRPLDGSLGEEEEVARVQKEVIKPIISRFLFFQGGGK